MFLNILNTYLILTYMELLNKNLFLFFFNFSFSQIFKKNAK